MVTQQTQSDADNGVISIIDQMANLDVATSTEGTATEEGIPLVCIPHDESKPITTLKLPATIAKNTAGDCLPEYVKSYFGADQASIDPTLLKEYATKHFGSEAFGQVQRNGLICDCDESCNISRICRNICRSPSSRYQSIPRCIYVFGSGTDTNSDARWMKQAVQENLLWHQVSSTSTTSTQHQMQLQSGTPSLGTEANSVEETDYTWTQDEDEIEITVYPVVTPSTQRDGGSIYRQKVDTDFVSKYNP